MLCCRAMTAPTSSATRKADLPTPSLLLDLDRFERNLTRLADHMRAAG